MAPEMISAEHNDDNSSGEQPYYDDKKTDVWAVGKLLFAWPNVNDRLVV